MLLRILCLFSLVSSLVALSPSNARILGGNYVTIDQAPWHAIVLYQSTPGLDVSAYSYETSGAIIKDNVVVVPARFVDDATRYRKVRAGSNGALVLGQIAEVKEIVFHEQYDGNTYEYNVAIVVLEAAYKLTDLISTIPFVGQDVVYPDGTYASITGYGVMGLPGNPSWWLQIIEIPLVNHEVCSNFYSSYNISITEQNICAGFLDNIGFSPCYLDGGGPLVIGGELIGLFERHWNCGLNGDPSIHVNIAAFSNWLKEKIESA